MAILGTFLRDGFTYQQRQVGRDGGKTRLSNVDVLAPTSLENLADAIEANLETEANALQCYIKGKAVQVQAAARGTKRRVPKADADRIYNNLPDDIKAAFMSGTDGYSRMEAEIAKVYAAEQM